jgi:queuine/archaeosine tRNA-ribosyltransferase
MADAAPHSSALCGDAKQFLREVDMIFTNTYHLYEKD